MQRAVRGSVPDVQEKTNVAVAGGGDQWYVKLKEYRWIQAALYDKIQGKVMAIDVSWRGRWTRSWRFHILRRRQNGSGRIEDFQKRLDQVRTPKDTRSHKIKEITSINTKACALRRRNS